MNKAIKTLFFALFVASNTIAEPVFPLTSILEQIEIFIREYPLHSGENTINIDTSCLSNGTYLYRTEIRGIKSDCKRMIIAR